jgi:RecA-family ATPase
MAAGQPFLGFTPPRPLRVFYLQAEIQYHYLRERLQSIRLEPAILAAAGDTFVATPKLKLLLDAQGCAKAAAAIREAFPEAAVDILCIDPIRNVFDGGPDGAGENDNTAMMFFLKDRVEVLREAVNPDCGVILAHHTKKLGKHQVKEDPFLALSGASALRGFYTSGLIMHRPDEERAAAGDRAQERRGAFVEADRQGRWPMGRTGRQPRAVGATRARGKARRGTRSQRRRHRADDRRAGGSGEDVHPEPVRGEVREQG